MKKLAFLLGIVFFTTVAFGQNKTDAAKQTQKQQPAKAEQVKPADKGATATAPAKKVPTPPVHHKKHKGSAKKAGTSKK